jgi:Xylose isomerase-like TIM barrel
MTRRQWAALLLSSPLLAKIDRSRLTIIADEAGDTVDQWLAFAQKYDLKWLELRQVQQDGHSAMLDSMSPSELKPIAKRLSDAGIRVSFFNSALLKYTFPGTVPIEKEDFYEQLYARQHLTPEIMYNTRHERLKRAIDAAHVFGAEKLRTFSFWRVKEPRSLFPRLIDLLGEMGDVAGKEGCQLLIETEYATNVATSEEMRDLLVKLPSPHIGINWDPQNSLELEPDVFPAGYHKLPGKRIHNVQVKAAGLFGPKKLDWAAILHALDADGYKGMIGLETHLSRGPDNFRMSHQCMDELRRMVES